MFGAQIKTILGFLISIVVCGCVSVDQLRTHIDLSLDDKSRMNSVIVLKKKEDEED
jgi:hypothetical protein